MGMTSGSKWKKLADVPESSRAGDFLQRLKAELNRRDVGYRLHWHGYATETAFHRVYVHPEDLCLAITIYDAVRRTATLEVSTFGRLV
jgi:hypothetical protein